LDYLVCKTTTGKLLKWRYDLSYGSSGEGVFLMEVVLLQT